MTTDGMGVVRSIMIVYVTCSLPLLALNMMAWIPSFGVDFQRSLNVEWVNGQEMWIFGTL